MSTKQDQSKKILKRMTDEEYNQELTFLETIDSFAAADCHPLPETTRAVMVDQVANQLKSIFNTMKLDYINDENLMDTPNRVASMWVNELMVGRYTMPPRIEAFPASHYYMQKVSAISKELKAELKTCDDELSAILDTFYFVVGGGFRDKPTLTDELLKETEKWVFRKELIERKISKLMDALPLPRGNMVSKTVDINSLCSHHFISFVSTDEKSSKCVINYIPRVGTEKALLGISKLQRIADWFGRRPQLQEHLNWQIKTFVMLILGTSDVMVSFHNIIHYCEKTRGVESHCGSTSSIEYSGAFMDQNNRDLAFRITHQ